MKTGRVIKIYSFHGRFTPIRRARGMYLRALVRFLSG